MATNGEPRKELGKKEKKELEKQLKKEKKIKDEENKAANQSLLKTQSGGKQRYATSELTQMWIVLKRALLFSRRDWVNMNRRGLFICCLFIF